MAYVWEHLAKIGLITLKILLDSFVGKLNPDPERERDGVFDGT